MYKVLHYEQSQNLLLTGCLLVLSRYKSFLVSARLSSAIANCSDANIIDTANAARRPKVNEGLILFPPFSSAYIDVKNVECRTTPHTTAYHPACSRYPLPTV